MDFIAPRKRDSYLGKSVTMAEQFQSDVPAPNVDLDNRVFWDAASRRELKFGRCCQCNKSFFYPRHFCPFCLSADVEWVSASGRGEIYAYTVMRRAERPFALAYVRLEEGPSMMTNIVECDFDRLRIGQAVKVVFVQSKSEALVPMFRPTER
jgi:uncharacterized OB-fold protein